MWTVWFSEILKELSSLPLLLLQYTAILGILSMVLMACRAIDLPVLRTQMLYGVVLGATGYLLTLLVSEFIQSPAKPYVRNDLLFLACLLGGWRGGGIGFGLILLARVQFGGAGNLGSAALDMLMMCAAGMVAHHLVRRRPLFELGWPQLLMVWLLRVLVGLLAIVVIAALGWVPASVTYSIGARRVFSALPALALLMGLYAIFRLDAQHHGLLERERQRGLLHPLTGLRNRRALLDHLTRVFAQVPAQSHTLVLVETANFVEMLLAQGHAWTDKLWCDLASTMASPGLRQSLRACKPEAFQFTDTTLAVVLHGVSSQEVEINDLANILHHDLQLAWCGAAGQPVPQLRLSVVHFSTAHHASAAEAMRDASLLLEQRMDLGASVHFFHQGFASQAALDAALLSRVMAWIDTHRPPMAYQPKCRLDTLEVIGAEALLRPEPVAAMHISPLQVLSVAARHNILAAFEWCTVQAVVRDAQRLWREAPGVSLSVNISSASLATPGFAQRVQDLLSHAHLPSQCLTMELTESSPLPKLESVNANLQGLLSNGIALSLDDFGSGYSGLTVLAHHPFAEVKIDHHMVAMIDEPRMKSAIQIALDTARHYNAKFVAEGVETQAHREALLDMGVDTGQGYLFAAALPISDLLDFVRASCRSQPAPKVRERMVA